MNRIQKYIFAMFIIALFGKLVYNQMSEMWCLGGGKTIEDKKAITFSVDSGFYKEAIIVEIEALGEGDIYYTLDGSKPLPDSAETFVYREGIYIEVSEVEKVHTIRAAIFAEDGNAVVSESRTYLMGANIEHRYKMPVLSVSGTPEEFYNYDNGIMVQGKLDEEYMAAHPEWKDFFENKMIPIYGNRFQKGKEAEKEVVVTLFKKDGSEIFSQNCGFRLYGNGSRMKNQPSFRLYARSEYDTQNQFDYVFFENQFTVANTIQSEYKRIIIRNSGSDNGYGFMRSELATRIAKESGFIDAPSASPVCVYLNGEYYGVHWFITDFDDKYFKETYGAYSGEMYVFEGKSNELEIPDTEEDANYIALVEEYNEKMEYFGNADLNDEINWNNLNAFLDVENFIHYIAIQHYVSNSDCLHNNYRVYRYYSPEKEYTSDTVFDGRYRILLFDMDYALGLDIEYSHSEPEKATLTAERMDGDVDYEKLFANMMKRKDCVELYIKYFLSMMNYYYSEKYVDPILNEMHNSRIAEITYMIEEAKLLVDNYFAPDVTEFDYVANEMALIQRYTRQRPDYALEDLQLAFGKMTPYILELENQNNANVTVDFATLSEKEFTGTYFEEVPVTISVQERPGYEFEYWLINDMRVEERSFIMTEDMIEREQVKVVCVCKPSEEADLCISGVKAKGGDYIEITNLSLKNKNLADYYITDNSTDRKSTLPRKDVKPGETVQVYCPNYSDVEALGKPIVNFNIKAGETVSLYRNDGVVVDCVEIPLLGSEHGIWKMDRYSGFFKEVIP